MAKKLFENKHLLLSITWLVGTIIDHGFLLARSKITYTFGCLVLGYFFLGLIDLADRYLQIMHESLKS